MYNYKRNINIEDLEELDLELTYKDNNLNGGFISFDFSETPKRITPFFEEYISKLKEKEEGKYKFIYGVANFNDIKDLTYLWTLYNLGLRMVSLTNDDAGVYGSGNNTTCGLTYMGNVLIKGATKLGIAIDLTKANKATTTGIISSCLESSSYILITEDLKDDETKKLFKEKGVYLSYRVIDDDSYQKLIKIVKEGYPKDKIILSFDHSFLKPSKLSKIFKNKYSPMNRFKKMISKEFGDDVAADFLEGNFNRLYESLGFIEYKDANKDEESYSI